MPFSRPGIATDGRRQRRNDRPGMQCREGTPDHASPNARRTDEPSTHPVPPRPCRRSTPRAPGTATGRPCRPMGRAADRPGPDGVLAQGCDRRGRGHRPCADRLRSNAGRGRNRLHGDDHRATTGAAPAGARPFVPREGRRVRQRARRSAHQGAGGRARRAIRCHHRRGVPVSGERCRHEGGESGPGPPDLCERHALARHGTPRGPVLPRSGREADHDQRSVVRQHPDGSGERRLAHHLAGRGERRAADVRVRRRVPRCAGSRRAPVQRHRTLHQPTNRGRVHDRRLGARHLGAGSIDQRAQRAFPGRERRVSRSHLLLPASFLRHRAVRRRRAGRGIHPQRGVLRGPLLGVTAPEGRRHGLGWTGHARPHEGLASGLAGRQGSRDAIRLRDLPPRDRRERRLRMDRESGHDDPVRSALGYGSRCTRGSLLLGRPRRVSPRLRSRPCARGHRVPHRFDRGRPHG